MYYSMWQKIFATKTENLRVSILHVSATLHYCPVCGHYTTLCTRQTTHTPKKYALHPPGSVKRLGKS